MAGDRTHPLQLRALGFECDPEVRDLAVQHVPARAEIRGVRHPVERDFMEA
jgi:hypothetical protein